MPRISAILSTFNDEKYLPQAVESILNQTYTDFEFIIIDDASTDGTHEILGRYRDERIICFRNQKNMERSFSRNRAAQVASGEFIAIMDADDISLPDRFATQIGYFESHPNVDVLGSSALAFESNSNKRWKRWQHDETHNEIAWGNITTVPFIHPTIMMRKDVFFQVGGYKEYYPCEDAELWMRMLTNRARFSNLAVPLILYRTSEFQRARQNASIAQAKEIKRAFLETFIGQNINTFEYDLILPIQIAEKKKISIDEVKRGVALLKMIVDEFIKRQLFDGGPVDIDNVYFRSVAKVIRKNENLRRWFLNEFILDENRSSLSQHYWLNKEVPPPLRWLGYFVNSPKQAINLIDEVINEKRTISCLQKKYRSLCG